MALPVKSQILGLEWAFQGQPFCDVPGKSTIDTWSMDYSYNGAPFVTNADSSIPPVTTSIKSILGVPIASVKSFFGVPIASIKSVNGVSNVS
jgi:hypothetical protein